MITIEQVFIKDTYAEVAELMMLLHQNEWEMFNKTAAWSDIESSYMRHCITMQQECDGTMLMAYEAGRPVGFIFAYVEEQDDSRIEIYTGKELYVSDGFVLPTYRRQGIYTKMNQMLEALYIRKGIKRFTRYAQFQNGKMHTFLQNAGYIPTRILFEKWL